MLNLGAKTPEYSLAQTNVPVSMKAYDDKFLLVTAYDKPSIDVISLADDQIIKQIYTKTQPDEIIIDKTKILPMFQARKIQAFILLIFQQ